MFLQAFDNPTDEWLPAWLLEEAAVEGEQQDGSVFVVPNRSSGPPGTEYARRAAMVDGCTIIKVRIGLVVAAGVRVVTSLLLALRWWWWWWTSGGDGCFYALLFLSFSGLHYDDVLWLEV